MVLIKTLNLVVIIILDRRRSHVRSLTLRYNFRLFNPWLDFVLEELDVLLEHFKLQTFEFDCFPQYFLYFVRFALDVFVLIYYGLFDSNHLILVFFVHFNFLVCRCICNFVINPKYLFVLVLKLKHLFSKMSVIQCVLRKFRRLFYLVQWLNELIRKCVNPVVEVFLYID